MKWLLFCGLLYLLESHTIAASVSVGMYDYSQIDRLCQERGINRKSLDAHISGLEVAERTREQKRFDLEEQVHLGKKGEDAKREARSIQQSFVGLSQRTFVYVFLISKSDDGAMLIKNMYLRHQYLALFYQDMIGIAGFIEMMWDNCHMDRNQRVSLLEDYMVSWIMKMDTFTREGSIDTNREGDSLQEKLAAWRRVYFNQRSLSSLNLRSEDPNRASIKSLSLLVVTYQELASYRWKWCEAATSAQRPLRKMVPILIVVYILLQGEFCYVIGDSPPLYTDIIKRFMVALLTTAKGLLMSGILLVIAVNYQWKASLAVQDILLPLLIVLLFLTFTSWVWNSLLPRLNLPSPFFLGGFVWWFPPLTITFFCYHLLWSILPRKYVLVPFKLINAPLAWSWFSKEKATLFVAYGYVVFWMLLDFVPNTYFQTASIKESWEKLSWGLCFWKVFNLYALFYHIGVSVLEENQRKGEERNSVMYAAFIWVWLYEQNYPYFERLITHFMGVASFFLPTIRKGFDIINIFFVGTLLLKTIETFCAPFWAQKVVVSSTVILGFLLITYLLCTFGDLTTWMLGWWQESATDSCD